MSDGAIAALDWRTLPLSGRVLVEASAGTGKTWNIGLIFLRLILEQQIAVEKILVVTFTEAAAQELRERLRARLVEAERCLQDPDNTDAGSALALWLARRYAGAEAKPALRRIQLARLDIDRAPIATIHAVCQRILREFPLEAGTAFAVEKLLDETELLRECLEDFWRRRYLVGASDPAEDDVLADGPEKLATDLRELLTRDATVLPVAASAPARARVLGEAYAYCRTEVPRRARARDGQTYAMLIDGVYERIRESRAFADRLFAEFPAALIDEFQDTERRQFAIFDGIYREASGIARGLMAMIGDPKQAIYAFRGGDIAAYLQAREQTDARFALATNQRSSSALVDACNALYAHAGGGFGDERVSYQHVTAAGRADRAPFVAGGGPFFIHAFRGDARDGKGKLIDGVGKLEELALEDCAARIVELLNDPARTIGGARVAPGDIAVLLPQNRQVAALRKKLLARRVPCVGGGRGSVFDTDIARELELVVYAVLHADDECAVRGALATRLLGKTYADIIAWQTDGTAFEAELERFARWREIARARGILAVLRELLVERGAALLALRDGERLLTDLRHLGEGIAEQEAVSGLDGAYAWFAALRREGDDEDIDAAEARQLRIESDARRVQLMTLHAAKGLEFGIVFLPLAWRVADRRRPRDPRILHFHDDSGQSCADLGSAAFAAHKVRHFGEDLQERLRLLYVGLTRAIHAVHVYWVDRKEAAVPGEDWQVPAVDRLIRRAQRSLDLDQGEASLATMAKRLGGVDILTPYAGPTADYQGLASAGRPRAVRAPLPAQRPFLWLHSFSSLTRNAVATNLEAAAADEAEADLGADDTESAPDPHLLALDVWRGRHFGDAVHKVLEDSPAAPVDRNALAARFVGLAIRPRAGDGDAFVPLTRMLERTRTSDLGDGLRLAELTSAARVAEFEFQFPVGVTLRRLREACAQHGCANVIGARLAEASLNGMLTGFADLIFAYGGRYHVLDYKTNRLGVRLADYQGAALDAAMDHHHYPLQALLYTVALHRYLRQRLHDYAPEVHLGDSWYLFLRGVGLEPGAGVWRRRWPAPLIEALDGEFAGHRAAA